MKFLVLLAITTCWSSVSGADSFFFQVQGSLLGISDDERTIATVEAKFNNDVSSTLHSNDTTIEVRELKNNYGHTSTSVFHGYVTTSVSNRSKLISLLKLVPTIALVYMAPVDSIPIRPITTNVQSLAAAGCAGDGILLPNNTCLCPPYTSGQYCQNINCQNYGILDGSRCACPPGYYSKYCENRGFRPAIENDVDLSKRSLVIVFSLADSMQQDFQYFRANLANMVYGMQGDDKDITSYLFFGFVLTVIIASTDGAKTVKSWIGDRPLTWWLGNGRPLIQDLVVLAPFVEALITKKDGIEFSGFAAYGKAMTYYIDYGHQLSDLYSMFDNLVFSAPAPRQPFLQQIIMAQSLYPDTRSFSNVLVFTDSGAGDATPPSDLFSLGTAEQRLISIANTWRNKLTFVLTQTSSKPIDTTGDEFDVYRRLAEATHGDLFVIDKSEIPAIMATTLNNYHKMENLAVRYRFNCSDIRAFEIPQEYESSETIRVLLTVDKNEGNPSKFEVPQVTDVNYVPLPSTSKGNYFALYSLPVGTSIIRVLPPTPGLVCSLRVFVTSTNTMLLSYTNNPLMDVGYPFAYKNVPQLATGLFIGFSTLNYLQIQPHNSRTASPISVAKQGFKRIGDSTYTYQFEKLSDCTAGPFTQNVEIYYGNGVTTRVLPGYCALPGPPILSNSITNRAVISNVDTTGYQCNEMNLNAIGDPRQHEFRQVVFAIENSVAMSAAASSLLKIVKFTINMMNARNTERQFSLVLFDDEDIRFVSSTYDGDIFTDQFSQSMTEVIYNRREVSRSRSLDVIFKVPEISLLSPTILYLFTSSPPLPLSGNRNPLTKNLQVNVFTLMHATNQLINQDLAFYQRTSGGRNLPVTVDGLLQLPLLLSSSLFENSVVLDKAVQNCSAPAVFDFYFEDNADNVVISVVGIDVQMANMVMVTLPTGYRVDLTSTFSDVNTIVFSVDPQKYAVWGKPWSLSVKTTSGPCFAQVRVVSPLTVIPGFSSSLTNDFPAESPFSLISADRHVSIVFHVPSAMAVIDTVTIGRAAVETPWFDSTSYLYQVVPRNSNSCAYQYLSYVEMLSSGLIRMEVSGSTAKSSFQRTFYFEQSSANATSCYNGSPNKSGSGDCVCSNGYAGQFCNQPICQNGGTRSTSICVCSTGFYGQLCESRIPWQSSTTAPVKTTPTTKAPQPTTTTTKNVDAILCFTSTLSLVLLSSIL